MLNIRATRNPRGSNQPNAFPWKQKTVSQSQYLSHYKKKINRLKYINKNVKPTELATLSMCQDFIVSLARTDKETFVVCWMH